jgi:WD40 repeat protein
VDAIWSVKAHDEQISSLDIDEKNNLVITCSYDKTVKIFNCITGEFIELLKKMGIGGEINPIGYY